MRCEKCGKKLRKNEKFCTVCGYYNEAQEEVKPDDWDDGDYNLLDEEKETENNQTINIGTIKDKKTVNYDYEEERDVEAYIGEDYKIIKKSPFNIWAFILNWMYVLYRKLYITGIIGLGIALIITLFYTRFIVAYLIISMLLLGVAFNPYYIFIIKQRIKRLETKYEGSDSFTFTGICKDKGGVNAIFALLIYFIFLVIILFCLIRVNYNKNHNTKFWEVNTENRANCSYYVKSAYNNVEKEKYGNVIIVEGKSGVNIWYGNLINYNVKLYDTVRVGGYLGEVNDNCLYLVYSKGNSYLDYNYLYINGVGIDGLGVERAQPGHPTHRTLFANDVIVIEGLRLKDVPAGEYFMVAAPLKLVGIDAAPSRVLLMEGIL